MDSGVLWDGKPALGSRSSIRILGFRPGDRKEVAILGTGEGVWVHWCGDRSFPCLGKVCTLCPAPHRWKGYLPIAAYLNYPAASGHKLECCILELGEENLPIFEGATRQQLFIVERTGKTKARALLVVQHHKGTTSQELPATFNVRPILMRMWGLLNRPGSRELQGGV